MHTSLPSLSAALGPSVDTYTIQDQADNYGTHTGTDAEMMDIIKSQGGRWRMVNNRTGLASIISYRIA